MFYGITFMRISVHAVRRREQKTRVLSFHCPVIVVFLIILLFCHPPTTLAQETDDDVLHYAYSVDLGDMFSDAPYPGRVFRYLPLYTLIVGGIGFAIGWIVGRNV